MAAVLRPGGHDKKLQALGYVKGAFGNRTGINGNGHEYGGTVPLLPDRVQSGGSFSDPAGAGGRIGNGNDGLTEYSTMAIYPCIFH